MRVTLEWLMGALKDKSLPSIDIDELSFREALSRFISTTPVDPRDLMPLEERIRRLEQFHCKHEFKDKKKGCLDSIFCSKCGVLHPDWEQTFPHRFGFADGENPVGYLIVGRKHYRTKARKKARKK